MDFKLMIKRITQMILGDWLRVQMKHVGSFVTTFLRPFRTKLAQFERRLVVNELTARCQRDYGSCSTRLRLVISLLLLLTLGITTAWGQTPNYSGTYYIGTRGYDTSNPANTNNFYLCPTEGWIYYKATDTFQEVDNGQPFITSYQCKDGVYDLRKAIWIIEFNKTEDGKDYYYIKHALDGKYLVFNGKISDASANRIRFHLEEINSPSALDDRALFIITKPSGKTYNVISPKNNNTYYFNLCQGNLNTLQGSTSTQSGNAKNDGPTGHKNDIHGTLGMFTSNTDDNAPMYLEPEPKSITEAPTITNNFDGTITITAASGTTVHYTTDGDEPTDSDPSTPNPISVDGTITTIKAYAKSTGCYDSRVVTYNLPKCQAPEITVSDGTVTITAEAGASIFYTTDPEAEPTEAYSSFSLGNATVIKAIAKRGGYVNSDITYYYNTVTVHSASEISNMRGNYLLASDFSYSSGEIGTSENPFRGVIDGQFNTFSGQNHALVAYANGATIKNVFLDNVGVNGNDAGNAGAICNEADGTTKIYNCGVLSGAVSGSANVGGIVGLIKSGSSVRVINCYSYANVSGGSNAAGIVGKNEGTVGDVRIALCMMYGNVTGATNISPVYTGSHANNVQDFTEYNFYLYSTEKDASGNRIEKIPYTAYNDQLAIDKEEYLTRFPFYRHILNTHRELACYFLFGDYSKDHVSEIGHWTLKKGSNVPKYPIIEAWEENTTKTPTRDHNNLPTTQDDYAGKLLTAMGSSGYLAVTVKIGNSTFSTDLPITDMDTLRYDFTYGKVVLPHANEFSGWTRDYSKICTGWKITNVGGSTSSSVTNYNFADRENPQKDIYDSNNPYIFAQGGNYIVPYNVSSITIEANFATAFYLSDPAYDMGYDTSYGNATPLGGSVPPTYHEKTVYTSLSTLVGALSNTTNPHEQAIVLVGNFHYIGGNFLNVSKAVTIMSVDEDCNQEPDYGWYSYMNVSRPTAPPLRFDFLPIIPMGMSSHVTGSTAYPGVSIWKVRGWFEMTETCVNIMHQCEIDSGDFTNNDNEKGNNRWIANSGYFTQIVRSFNKACNKLSYIQIGGNAYVKEFYPGNHSKKTFTNKVVPINVTGGEIEECCMTGYHVGGNLEGNNIYFWGAGGRIHKFLGAYMETPVQASGQTGGVNMNAKIDHARIWQFFGGGTTSAATITGNINVTINNSLVDFYCGGPEFGDMVSGKSVTTNATGTTFRKYYGAGFGGTSLTNVFVDENEGLAISNGDTEFPQAFTFYTNRRLKTDNNYGIGTAYKFEYILSSTGEKVVPRWYIGRARFSLATTGSVINNLTNCIVEGDFYGAGCQGKVNGTVSSTLTNCTIKRGVFGGGYKAANNAVKVYPETQPTYSKYNSEKGLFSGFGSVEPDTWKWEQGSSANETYNDQRDELYTQSSITMTDLGNVTGNITLTIDGGYVGGTVQGATPEVAATATTDAIPAGGSVYGGGNESKSLSNTTVTLKGDAVIYGNVFGGGNKAEVRGSTEVNIVNEE